MFNITASKAIFSLPNAFIQRQFIVNSFMKANSVDWKSICLLKITHQERPEIWMSKDFLNRDLTQTSFK